MRERSFWDAVGMLLQGEFMLCEWEFLFCLVAVAKTSNPIGGQKWLELETDQFNSAAAADFSCFG